MEMLALLQAAAPPHAYRMSQSGVFLFFFIMLGPLKLIGPYFMQTRMLPPVQARRMAWKVFALAVVAILVAGLLGSVLLRNWKIDPPVMQLAAGLVFLLVALQMVLAQYEPPGPTADTPVEPQLMQLVFPITVTPYGVATVIVLMALSADLGRSLSVLGMAIGVMALNLLAMLFVRPLMRGIGMLPLQILGAVLGILQVGLAMQLMVTSLADLGLGFKVNVVGP
ncbi:MarC family protein [Lysobacter sp. LF1]|uniref:UPF0056 membrane protein n=1 Tax=Lysobacter stagni TaxID=3045172 RepID=A0ABT6XHT0_9GAMM|nr:MarC family protein [Lysobacter sp. LF1]MDI9239633.1 MarC family protein [Lysobacter sp. LF1]